MKTRRLLPGQRAPVFRASDLNNQMIDLASQQGDKVLLCFFRYASCPLCNLRISELIREHDHLTEHGIRVLAVFQSPAEKLHQYVGRQAPPFAIIPDPQTRLYQRYGLESSWKGFFRAWTLGLPRVVKAVIGEGFLPGSMEGDIHRIPGDFLIDEQGVLLDVYYGVDIGDHMPLDRILNPVDNSAIQQFEESG